MAQNEWHVWQPFRDEFSGNLAVFCSDERYVGATSEFLKQGLNLERCDLLVLPGGPAFIAENNAGLLARVQFLVHHHHIQRIVLVTHADCGHYKERERKLDPEALRTRQCDEARAAARHLEAACPFVRVEAILAARDAWGFVFTRLNTQDN